MADKTTDDPFADLPDADDPFAALPSTKRGDASAAYKKEIAAEARRRQATDDGSWLYSNKPNEAITSTQAAIDDSLAFGAYPQIMAAGREPASALKGIAQTFGLYPEDEPGAPSAPSSYARERDILRAQIEQQHAKDGGIKRLGMGLLTGAVLAPAGLAEEALAHGAKASIPVVKTFGEKLWNYVGALGQQSKIAAPMGAAYGFNQETGGWGEKAMNAVEHGVGAAMVAPLIKMGIDAPAAAYQGVRNLWRGKTGPRANKVYEEAADVGAQDTVPPFVMGGSVMRGFAAHTAPSMVGGEMRQGASAHIDNLQGLLAEQFQRTGGAKDAADAGEMAQAFLRDKLLKRHLPEQGRDPTKMTPQEMHDLSGVPPGPNTEGAAPKVEPVVPDRVPPEGIGKDYIDTLHLYDRQVDNILSTDGAFAHGMQNFLIKNVSYDPQKKNYVVTKVTGDTYLVDWRGNPATGANVKPDEAIYLQHLVGWLNEQPKQYQAYKALKAAADQYAGRLLEEAKSVKPTPAIEPPLVAPRYREVNPTTIGADPRLGNEALDAKHLQVVLENRLESNLKPQLAHADEAFQSEPFFRKTAFVQTGDGSTTAHAGYSPFEYWKPVFDQYAAPKAYNPVTNRFEADIQLPLAFHANEDPALAQFVKWAGSEETAQRLLHTYRNYLQTRHAHDVTTAKIDELQRKIPELDLALSASHQRNYEKAVTQAKAEAEQQAARENEVARLDAQRSAQAETARRRNEAIETVRPQAQALANKTLSIRDAQAAEEARAATEAAQAEANATFKADLERRVREPINMAQPKERLGYQDQFDVGYEQVERNRPRGHEAQINILGKKATDTEPQVNTNTSNLIRDIALEARQGNLLPGYKSNPFDSSGELRLDVMNHLRGNLGPDVTTRLEEYSRKRASGLMSPTFKGLRDLRTSVRRAAEDAEAGTLYPGQPRPADAAMLRRLEGAVDQDIEAFARGFGPRGDAYINHMRAVDRAYKEYIHEIRQPLAKIFGQNNRTGQPIDPSAAIQDLREATQVGTRNFNVLKAFYRVIDEKGSEAERLQLTAALLHGMFEGRTSAERLGNFIKSYGFLSPEARREMSKGAAGPFFSVLDRFSKASETMAPFIDVARPNWQVRPLAAGYHALASNVPMGLALWGTHWLTGWPLIFIGTVGTKLADVLISKPFFGSWLRNMPFDKGPQSPEWIRHANILRGFVTESLGWNKPTADALFKTFLSTKAKASEAEDPEAAADEMALRAESSAARADGRMRLNGPPPAEGNLSRQSGTSGKIEAEPGGGAGGPLDASLPLLMNRPDPLSGMAKLGGPLPRSITPSKPKFEPSGSDNDLLWEPEAIDAYGAQNNAPGLTTPAKMMRLGGPKPPPTEAGAYIDPETKQLVVDIGRNRERQDSAGTDQVGSFSRRLPGERAFPPNSTVLTGGLKGREVYFTPDGQRHEIDPENEADAWAPRVLPEKTGPQEERGTIVPLVKPAGAERFEAGVPGLAHAPFKAAEELMSEEGQYRPGPERDARGVRLSTDIAGAAMAGSLATAAVSGIERNSVGTFISDLGARRLAEAGYPTAERAILMAKAMAARKATEADIRAATNRLIEADDPALGGVHQGKDGKWRVELDDSQVPWTGPPPELMRPGDNIQTTMGEALPHPYLEIAHPGYKSLPLDYANPAKGDYSRPRTAIGTHARKNGESRVFIRAGEGSDPRSTGLHEGAGHYVQAEEGFAPGSSLTEELAASKPGDSIRDAASRRFASAGEVEARAIQARRDLTAKQRRDRHPEKDEDIPRDKQVVRERRGREVSEDRPRDKNTPERLRQIADHIAAGKKPAEVAAEMGLSIDAVRWAIHTYRNEVGAAPRAKVGSDPALRQKFSELHDGTRTYAEIGKEMGLSATQVKNAVAGQWRDIAGPPRRPSVEWTPERIQHFDELYDGKRGYSAIAEDMGLTTSQLRRGVARNSQLRRIRDGLGLLPPGPSPTERFGKRTPEAHPTHLDARGIGLEGQIRGFEDKLKKSKLTPEKMAEAINAKFGKDAGDVTAKDIKSGNVWWRVGEASDIDTHTVSGDTFGSGPIWERVNEEGVLPRTHKGVIRAGSLPIGDKKTPEPQAEKILYAGEEADNADLGALDKAQKLEKKGASRSKIWNDTGWWKAGDGQWRFELDDSKATLSDRFHEAVREGSKDPIVLPLREALTHKILDDNYPDLMDSLKIVIAPIKGKPITDGYYNPEVGTIYIRPRTPKAERLRLVIHEIQHAIQGAEGMPQAPEGTRYAEDGAEAEAYNAGHRHDWSQKERQARPPWDSFDLPEKDIVWGKGRGLPTPPGTMKLGGPPNPEAGDADHHSTRQPRNKRGQFNGPPQTNSLTTEP